MSQLVKISILALIVGLELALPAQAQVNYYWDLDPLSSGDYTTLSNWDPDYPATPTTNDFMHVNNGGTCLITSALMNLPSYIYAGRNEGTSGTITQSAGIVTIDGGLRVGYTGGTGTYNMTGGTLTCSAVPTDYGLFVGARAGGASFGDGTINMSGGAQATIGKQARIGEAGGTGRLYMSGASTMSIAELGYIGLDGGATGIVDLSGTASISIGTDAYIGANASSQGTIGLAGDSTLNVGGNAFIGIGAGGTGTINMNDLTVANTSDANFNGGSVNFGYAGALGNIATGVLNMDGSTTFNSKVIGLGVWNHSRGVLNLAGNAQLYATERISAGDNWGAGAADAAAGRGEIHLSGNATLTTPSVRLGTFGYGDGYMTVSSTAGNTATANVAGWFGIGIYGGNGELVMDDNGLVNHTADNVTVGDGTGNLSDGTPKPSVGVVTMNGGTFNNSSSNSLIGIGINGGTGTWTQNDGTLLSPTGYVLLGSGGGTATMNLNGGVIEVPRIQSSGSPASTTLNFNGGTLRAAADGVLITDNDATPVLNVVVQSGGAVVDTNGKDASITRPLLDGGGGGGLTKQGAGALTLTKANTYMGTTAVSAGDLLVSSTGSLATTGVSLTSGTRLALPSTTAVTVPLASLSLANASTIDLPLTTTAAGANAVTTAALTIPTGGTANLRVGSQGASLQVGTPYTVINGYSGLPAGTIAAQSLIRGYTALANVTPSAVTVTLSGSAAPMSVTWSGNVDNKWDVVGTANWNAGMDQFYELDNVTFDSSGSAQPNVYVAERVHANKIDVNDGGVNYTLSGPGEVIVQTTLDKRGSGTYTFDNTGGVSVGGAVIVGGGTLSFGANSGDTTLPGAVSMVNYSTLDVSGGASLTLNGVVSDDGYTGLHKTGTGTLVLSNATNNYSGSSNFAGGTVVVPNLANGGATSSIGASSADPSNLRLAGATLQYTGPNVTIDRGFGLDGDGTFIMDNNLTMTGGVKSTAGLLYKRGAGTLELISPPDDLGLPYVNQIGDYLVVYGGGVILDGVATTEFQVTTHTYVGDGAGRDGTLLIEGATKLTVNGTSLVGTASANGSLTMTGDATYATAGETHWGTGSGGSATVTMSGTTEYSTGGYSHWGYSNGAASVTMTGDAVYNGAYGHVGGNDGGSVDLTMDDNAHIEFLYWFNFTEANGTGNLLMNGNSSISAGSIDFGWGTNASSTTVLNETANITVTGGVNIGVHGNNAHGSVTLNDDATINATGFNIGWIDSADLSGALGELTLNDSSEVNVTGAAAIGNVRNANGILRMTGDSSFVATSWISVGNSFAGGGVGEAFISGNALLETTGNELEIAWGGTGILHVGDGTLTDNAVVRSSLPVVLGWGTQVDSVAVPTNSRIDLNGGGSLEAPGIITGNDGAGFEPVSSVLNFNGGTLRTTADNADFMTNGGASATFLANVQAGGAVIDTNGYNIGFSVALTEDAGSTGGGLTKAGLGTLTMTSTDHTYTGDTSVLAGTLSTADSEMFNDDSSLSIAVDALLDLNYDVDFSTVMPDTIAGLTLGGVAMTVEGTYGSTASGATYANDTYFTGLGMVLLDLGIVIQIPGDATGDQIVDELDAERLALHWGHTTQSPTYTWWEMGDFNGDDKVDAADAAIMAANWGDHTGGEESPVPEPGMMALLVGFGLALVARRTRR